MPSQKILVVDDHLDTRIICRELFTHFGYEVFEACDGVEAVDVAFTNVPDVILLDFLMPNANGLETLKLLREHSALSKTRIILYTAAATELENLRQIEGIEAVLLKPVEPRHLLAAVDSSLRISSSS